MRRRSLSLSRPGSYMLGVKQEPELPYRITGLAVTGTGGELATSAGTAKKALEIARQWASQGATNIIITNPDGESYDLDRFDMIASTKEEGRDADRT